jgi:hypothetical protein
MARLDRAIQEQKRIFFNMAWMAGSEPGHDKTVFAKEIARTFVPFTLICDPGSRFASPGCG